MTSMSDQHQQTPDRLIHSVYKLLQRSRDSLAPIGTGELSEVTVNIEQLQQTEWMLKEHMIAFQDELRKKVNDKLTMLKTLRVMKYS